MKQQPDIELNEMIMEKIEAMERPDYEGVPRLKKGDFIAISIIAVISLFIFYGTYLSL